MPVVKSIRRRGATITVEAYAEVLFMPGGQVFNWQNRFSQRIEAATVRAAPSNSRPRWAHYGKPLKQTIKRAYPRFWGNGRDKMRVYGAVGSTAPYAAFVDQGTGVYGGNGPYPAKILPPWEQGSPSLYEATWRPGGPRGRRVAPVMIKGQRGQHFFDKGLAAGFRSMRMRSFALPGDGGPKITEALNATPTLGNFLGATPVSPAFIGQLNEWRRWRDEAWADPDRGLGRGGGIGSKAHEAAVRPPRPPKPPKPAGPTRAQIQARYLQAIKRERNAVLAKTRDNNPNAKVTASGRRLHNGQYMYQITVTFPSGRSQSFWWPSQYQAALSM